MADNNGGDAINVKRKQIVLLGVGGVGRALLRALMASRVEIAARVGVTLEVAALADSTAFLAPSVESIMCDPLTDDDLHRAIAAKESHQPLRSLADARPFASPLELLQRLAPHLDGNAIIVDTTASDATAPALIYALEAGHAVVLANKKPLAIEQEVFDRLTRAGVTEGPLALDRIRWETTCGAALPVIVTLARLQFGGDQIKKITGTFSGTLGYLMSGLQQGRRVSEVVREAHELGYTEPDPRDDLGGVDIARKALILARSQGWRMELVDVTIESLFPLHMASLSVAQFLAALPQMDAHFAQLVKNAASQGGVLRYAASIADGKCRVGPTVAPAESPLGRLTGTDNLVEFHTRWYSPTPLVIQGRGAGVEVTASGILADIVDLAI